MNITVEQFNAASQKHRLTQSVIEINQLLEKSSDDEKLKTALEDTLKTRRKPETIFGFMTKEQAEENIKNVKEEDLLIHGLTIISDGKAFFLTDDSSLGNGVLPKAFIGSTFRLPLRTAHKSFNSVEEFCSHYCRHRDNWDQQELYLDSAQAVVDYVNSNY